MHAPQSPDPCRFEGAVPTAAARVAERLPRWDLLLCLLGALLTALLFWPLVEPPFGTDALVGTDSYRTHDWLEVAKFDHFARRAMLSWGRLPFWNPLVAGGLAQFAHPSDGSVGPLFLPSLLFGETLGLKVVVVVVAVLGAVGTWLFARVHLRASALGATVAALTYGGAGWLPSRVAIGFYESCLMAAWPLVLVLWLWPGPRPGPALATAALLLGALALQLQLAVPVLVLWMVLFAGASAVLRPPVGPGARSLLVRAMALLVPAALLGGHKYLPMLELLDAGGFREPAAYPTHHDAWYLDLRHLWYGLFHLVPAVPLVDRDGNPRVEEYVSIAPGLGSLLLAGWALLRLRRRDPLWPVVGCAAVFCWLSLGPHAPWDGFRLLHPLPLFASMRGPLRYFTWPILFALSLLAGLGLDRLVGPRAGCAAGLVRGGVVALTLILNGPTLSQGRELLRTSFLYAMPRADLDGEPQSEGLFGFSLGGAQSLNLRKYLNTVRGVPTVYTAEDLPLPAGPTPEFWLYADGRRVADPGYLGEAWPVDADGTPLVDQEGHEFARVVELRANEVIVETNLAKGGFVAVNQNHRPGWTCGGDVVIALARDRGPIFGFRAPAGLGQITSCRYQPPWFVAGLVLTAAGFVLVLLLASGRVRLPVLNSGLPDR